LPNLWWAFILLGVCAGFLSGTLLIPALVLLFHFEQKSAHGTALAVMLPMALVGALRYKMNAELDIRMIIVCLVAAGAVVGALMGSELAARLPSNVLRRVFAVFMLIVAVNMLLPGTFRKRPAPAHEGKDSEDAALAESSEMNNGTKQ